MGVVFRESLELVLVGRVTLAEAAQGRRMQWTKGWGEGMLLLVLDAELVKDEVLCLFFTIICFTQAYS